jgi:hypothetical protein
MSSVVGSILTISGFLARPGGLDAWTERRVGSCRLARHGTVTASAAASRRDHASWRA